MRTESRISTLIALSLTLTLVTGCKAAVSSDMAASVNQLKTSAPPQIIQDDKPVPPASQTKTIALGQTGLVRVTEARLESEQTAILVVHPAAAGATGEQIVNVNSPSGVANYVTAAFPHNPIRDVVIRDGQEQTDTHIYINSDTPVSRLVDGSSTTFALGQHIQVPPPGTTIDHTITPLARENAPEDVKTAAVERIASSLEGMPFIWGDNPGLGDEGVDAANFVAYVYHHALGYQMSTNAEVQWDTVGISAPLWDLRPGDLLIFEHGRHVGIYLGNDEMMQAGGGLGEVGTIALGPESYWGKRLSAVRRMY